MFKVVLLLGLVLSVRSKEKTSMYMKRAEVNDQAMSGSGYSFNGHDGKPQEYSFELGDDGHGLKILKDLGYDPFVESQRYADENSPLPYEQYTKEYSQTADGKPVAFYVNENSYKIPGAEVQIPSLYPHVDEYRKLGIYPQAYPYAAGYDHASHKTHKTKGGKSYSDFAAVKRGEKGDKGYNTVDAFSKGLSGRYDNKDANSFYDKTGGNKHLFFDDAGNYAVRHAAGKASRGGSFGQNDSHNKGSKTTGYHKVYHKDDYNKQHNFYDKADRNGHFNKYGDFNAKHGSDEGHFVNGAHADSGYDSNKYGASDSSDKGKFDEIARGFRKADGNEGFFQDYTGFKKKGGKASSDVTGYAL